MEKKPFVEKADDFYAPPSSIHPLLRPKLFVLCCAELCVSEPCNQPPPPPLLFSPSRKWSFCTLRVGFLFRRNIKYTISDSGMAMHKERAHHGGWEGVEKGRLVSGVGLSLEM